MTTSQGPGSVEAVHINNSNQSTNNINTSTPTNLPHPNDLGDLNFDPAAIIDGEGQGQEGLNVINRIIIN